MCSLSIHGRHQQICRADRQTWKGGLDAGVLVECFAKWNRPAGSCQHRRGHSISSSSYSPVQKWENAPRAITAPDSNCVAEAAVNHPSTWAVCGLLRCLENVLITDRCFGIAAQQTNGKAESNYFPHLGIIFKPNIVLSFCNLKYGAHFSCISTFLFSWSPVSQIHFVCHGLP